MKTYDTFTPNILEMQGKIERKSFNFCADNCKVWDKGKCIADWNSTFQIDAEVNHINGKIEVTLDNSELSKYIADSFAFSEISLNHDRVLWSNNLLSGNVGADKYKPSNMSLFYYRGILSRIYLNVYSPKEILLELTSNNAEQVSDVENPLKRYIEKFLIQKKGNNQNIAQETEYNYPKFSFFVLKRQEYNTFISNATMCKIFEEEVSEEEYNIWNFNQTKKRTGRFHFLIHVNVTEKLVGISNKTNEVHEIPWQLLREEEKYLVFCGWGDPMSTGEIGGLPQFNYHEIGIEKSLFANLIAQQMRNNPSYFSVEKMKRIIGLEGFKFENGRIYI